MFRVITALLLLFSGSVSLAGDTAPDTIAADLIRQDALLIDVRSAEEFAGGHIEGAINIPHDDTEALAEAIGDRERLTVLYCGSGRRAGRAQATLAQQGYMNIHNGTGLKRLQSALATENGEKNH